MEKTRLKDITPAMVDAANAARTRVDNDPEQAQADLDNDAFYALGKRLLPYLREGVSVSDIARQITAPEELVHEAVMHAARLSPEG